MFGPKGLAPAAPPDDSTVLYRVDSNVITKVGSVGAGGVRAKYLSASVYLPVILFIVFFPCCFTPVGGSGGATG